jgi:hypothetical protein
VDESIKTEIKWILYPFNGHIPTNIPFKRTILCPVLYAGLRSVFERSDEQVGQRPQGVTFTAR